MCDYSVIPGSKVSWASWLRSESVRLIDDEDVLRLPLAIGPGDTGEVGRCDEGMIGSR